MFPLRTGDGVCITYFRSAEHSWNSTTADDFRIDVHGISSLYPISETSNSFLATDIVCVNEIEEHRYSLSTQIRDEFSHVVDNRLSNNIVNQIYGNSFYATSISVETTCLTPVLTSANFTFASASFERADDYEYAEEQCYLNRDIFNATIKARDQELKFALKRRLSHGADVT